MSPASPSPESDAANVIVRWCELSASAVDAAKFLEESLEIWGESQQLLYAAIVLAQRGRWETIADFGPQQVLPFDALGAVLDQNAPRQESNWSLVPLSLSPDNARVLAVQTAPTADPLSQAQLQRAAQQLGRLYKAAQRNERRQWRLDRLEAILDIAAQWNQTHEMSVLLEQMAETSTRLLQAERASIFLWDQANHLLIGRPALGIEGGVLEIPDDAGLVAQVVRTGQLGRVDEGQTRDAEIINRDVDRQLDYQTRSLLCAPLRGNQGEVVGAFEVLNKHGGNFTDEDEEALTELAAHASVALENTQDREQLLSAKQQIVDEAAAGIQWVGQCSAIEALRKTIDRVASTDLAVLILGENGTGKDVVAHMIHYLSVRRDQPFVAVNCAAISQNLLESELFGHEKGAFTGAQDERAGKFETASGGTLFLDEIGDMSLDGQASLLRVLEDKVVVRVGGSRPIATDTRVFAATNQDLVQLVRDKRFREDLYYRLNVVTMDLPPLRDRGDDVMLLAEHFLTTFCQRARRKVPKFTGAARRRLLEHTWPGNVRELRNLMERLAYLSDEERIDVSDLSFIVAPNASSESLISLNSTLADATRDFQVDFIKRQIEASRGRMTEAAKRLGLHRSNLYRKMKQLGMSVDEED